MERVETCVISGREIAYRRSGAGSPVLLVHGITTYSFLWREVAARLAPSHDVVAPDLLGCGDSEKPLDVSYGLAAHAERSAALVRALGLGPVHLVGHDLGGGIAQILAVRHPELVRTLALVNPVGYDYWPVQPILALRTPVVRQIMLAALDLGALALVVRRGLVRPERLTPELLADFQRPLRTPEGRRALVHFARCLDSGDLTSIAASLRSIAVPTAIVWGAADPYLPAVIGERLHRDIPGSRLVTLPSSGHFVPIDEPERLAGVLLQVIDGRASAA
jgi:pimeloyl-ACP methyl ester carboxylesterase